MFICTKCGNKQGNIGTCNRCGGELKLHIPESKLYPPSERDGKRTKPKGTATDKDSLVSMREVQQRKRGRSVC